MFQNSQTIFQREFCAGLSQAHLPWICSKFKTYILKADKSLLSLLIRMMDCREVILHVTAEMMLLLLINQTGIWGKREERRPVSRCTQKDSRPKHTRPPRTGNKVTQGLRHHLASLTASVHQVREEVQTEKKWQVPCAWPHQTFSKSSWAWALIPQTSQTQTVMSDFPLLTCTFLYPMSSVGLRVCP